MEIILQSQILPDFLDNQDLHPFVKQQNKIIIVQQQSYFHA